MSALLENHIATTQPVAIFKLREGPSMTREQIVAYARVAGVTAEELEEQKPFILKDLMNERHIMRRDGKVVRVLKTQDKKYGVIVETSHGEASARLVNMETGEPIPDDEPVMIFRAQDQLAPAAIGEYVRVATGASTAVKEGTVHSASDRLEEFHRFQRENPDRCKLPT